MLSSVNMSQNTFIIITTINPPTKGIRHIAELPYPIIVVGDQKTPNELHYPNITFLSLAHQQELPYRCVKQLPHNHYTRKMRSRGHLLNCELHRSVEENEEV